MSVIQANSSGLVSGKFTIPANIPVGTKLVEFVGAGGSTGSAQFTGTNTLITSNQRMTVRQTQEYYDPLAQTFSPTDTIQLSGVDLWFTAKGTSKVVVQVRGVDTGFPNRSIYAEKRIAPADILINGSPTRVEFAELPVLTGNTEYAIVVLCDDADAALSVAQLGKWDTSAGKWVTSQPYSVGVLLSSSNASTWTAHQDMDMAFRLLIPAFTATTRTIDLGTTSVTNASDLLVMADVVTPSSACNCVFRLTLIGNSNQQVTVAAYQSVSLASRYTGSVKLEAILTGTATDSPILYPEVQLAIGNLQESSTYITREFSANAGTAITVTLEAQIPGSSAITVEVYNGTTWSTVTFDSGVAVDGLWIEQTYKKTGFSGTNARFRITLTGNAAARPMVRNLRAIFT